MTADTSGVSRGVTLAFRLGLFAQAILGLAQFSSGLALWVAPMGSIPKVVEWLTRNEIVDDPQSRIVQLLTHWAQNLSAQSEGFYAYYLVGHGLLNLFAALALLRHWPGSYQLSMTVLSLFMVFQLWEYAHTFDPMLVVLTLIDVVVIVVITVEHRQRQRRLVPH